MNPGGYPVTTTWDEHDVLNKIIEVLRAVHLNNAHHPFGRPYLTAYQLAIAVDERYPEVRVALGYPIGGTGVGQHNSLAQYLSGELSRRIGANDGAYPVEGAFVSNEHVEEIKYRSHDGSEIVSSLTGTGYDLSMFRLALP